MTADGNILARMTSPAVSILLVGSALCVWAQLPLAQADQKPVIDPDRIVNAASLAYHPLKGPELSPGGLFTISGQNLAADTVVVGDGPLPTSLADASVSVNGILAPLLSVSPTSITFQAPTILTPFGFFSALAALTVTTAEGPSDPVLIPCVSIAPGLFTQDGSGCGQGRIFNETGRSHNAEYPRYQRLPWRNYFHLWNGFWSSAYAS